MKTKIVEVTNGKRNWGKFLLAAFTHEWAHPSSVLEGRLLPQIGWDVNQIWILDLQTCEGAAFTPGGLVSADLEKHGVWVCPMYEPFLEYLWKLPREQVLSLDLPDLIDIPDAEFHFRGYRRPGPPRVDYVLEELFWQPGAHEASELVHVASSLDAAHEWAEAHIGKGLDWKERHTGRWEVDGPPGAGSRYRITEMKVDAK